MFVKKLNVKKESLAFEFRPFEGGRQFFKNLSPFLPNIHFYFHFDLFF